MQHQDATAKGANESLQMHMLRADDLHSAADLLQSYIHHPAMVPLQQL
jgi:hypothetical protein